jgi:hypothetical protein
MEVTDLRREVCSFLMWAEASIKRLNSSAQCSISLHSPGTSYGPNDSSPKELGQVTLVAKQPDPAAQSNGFEDFD